MSNLPTPVESADKPSPSSTRQLPIALLLAFITAGVALLGSFLPWARVLVFTVNGTDGDGVITAIASGTSLGLLLALLRATQRRYILAVVATIASAVSAATYSYDLARLSNALGGRAAASSIFGDAISVGFGLVIGALAASVALTSSIVVAVHVKRTNDAHVADTSWTPRHALLLALSSTTLSIAAADRMWVLSVILALATIAAFVGFRKTTQFSRLLTAVAIVAAVGGLGGGIYGATKSESSGIATCASIFEDGASVDAVHGTNTCTSNGKTTFVFTMDDTCYDGSTLYTNKYGWGYSGKSWNTSGEAPRSVCMSNAKESCTTLFADGSTTNSSWEYLAQDCFGPDGKPVSVSSNIDFCEDFSTLVSNDYGWGKEGEPWHAHQTKPSTC